MILLSIFCALISAAAIAVAGFWQRYGAPAAGPGRETAREKDIYNRFVADLDRRVAGGDLDADLAAEERAEAGRALLRAREDEDRGPEQVKPAVAVAVMAGVIALSFSAYLLFGHPQVPDQPYASRLAAWTAQAEKDPGALAPQAIAAVLKQRQARFGNQPMFWLWSGHIDMEAGQFYEAAKAFQRAQTLSPSTFTAWSEMGEALTYAGRGTVGPDAHAAFMRAIAVDANDGRAHFYLGREAVAQGHYDDARGHFSTVLAQLPANDPRRAEVVDQLKATDQAELMQKAMQARISGMVATLAAQLKTSPDNPDGWARLLRSYSVLGDNPAHEAALKAMRAEYATRPAIAADIEAKAQAAVGAENTGGVQ
jgi:cytochrome c-type biogenesis protein CcmH